MKWIWRGLALLILMAAGVAGYAYWTVTSLSTTKITQDLWVLEGIGGNVAVLRTDDGAVVVDSMVTKLQGRRIRSIAQRLTDKPVVTVINTHYHLDHTHGNPGFDIGTLVVSTGRTLDHLKEIDGDYWEGDAAAFLPSETVEDSRTLKIGGKTIFLFHPGPAHTDGDLVVYFSDEKALHMGDMFFNHHFPNIDLEAGGTVAGWPAAIDEVLGLGLEVRVIIPGHGTISDEEGLLGFRAFMQELADAGATAAANGWTLEQMLENTQLKTAAGYTEIKFSGFGLGLTRDFVLTRSWEEATGAVKPNGAS